MKRKTFLAVALIGAAAAAHLPAQAQSAVDFPNKPVTLFTAFAPGSGPDATLRLVADKLGRLWNQRVMVENRPGGGGFIAMEAARRTAADGYTLLQLDSDHLGAVPHLYKQRGAAAVGAFEPVASIFRTTFLVAVGTDSKLKTMTDLIAAAKAEPGRVNYGSWGVGSPGHLGAELLEDLTGIRMQHVPFREVSQLYPAVGSGDVGWSLGTLPSSSGAYKAGAPAGFDVNAFVVLVAPKGLPAPVRAKINADMGRLLADPEIRARFDTFAFEPISWSPEEIARAAEAKSRLYEGLVKKANISLE